MPSISGETFAAAQQSALDCVFTLITCCPDPSKLNFQEIIPKVIKTGFSNGRPPVKRKTAEILLESLFHGQTEFVLHEICSRAVEKAVKFSISSLNFLAEALNTFGPSVIPPDDIVKVLCTSGILDNRNGEVRKEAILLGVELLKWLGDGAKAMLKPIKPQQMKELEEAYEKTDKERPIPKRQLRSQVAQSSSLVGSDEEASSSSTPSQKGSSAKPSSAAGADLYDVVSPVEVLPRLVTKQFDIHKEAHNPKWNLRKAAFDQVAEMCSVPHLAQGDYKELLQTLRNGLNDTNVAVVCSVVNVFTKLALSLRKGYANGNWGKAILPVLLDKLKEKKTNLITAVKELCISLCQFCISADELVTEASSVLSASKVKEQKLEITRLFAELVPKLKDEATGHLKNLSEEGEREMVEAMVKTVNDDGDGKVRESAAKCLGVLGSFFGRDLIESKITRLTPVRTALVRKCLDEASAAERSGSSASSSQAPSASVQSSSGVSLSSLPSSSSDTSSINAHQHPSSLSPVSQKSTSVSPLSSSEPSEKSDLKPGLEKDKSEMLHSDGTEKSANQTQQANSSIYSGSSSSASAPLTSSSAPLAASSVAFAGKVEIGKELNRLIPGMNSAKWYERRKALEEATKVIESTQKRCSVDGLAEFMAEMTRWLTDSNRIFVQECAKMSARLAQNVGNEIALYAKVVVPPLLQLLNDSNTRVREAALQALDEWALQCNFVKLMRFLPVALKREGVNGRKEVLGWINAQMASLNTAQKTGDSSQPDSINSSVNNNSSSSSSQTHSLSISSNSELKMEYLKNLRECLLCIVPLANDRDTQTKQRAQTFHTEALRILNDESNRKEMEAEALQRRQMLPSHLASLQLPIPPSALQFLTQHEHPDPLQTIPVAHTPSPFPPLKIPPKQPSTQSSSDLMNNNQRTFNPLSLLKPHHYSALQPQLLSSSSSSSSQIDTASFLNLLPTNASSVPAPVLPPSTKRTLSQPPRILSSPISASASSGFLLPALTNQNASSSSSSMNSQQAMEAAIGTQPSPYFHIAHAGMPSTASSSAGPSRSAAALVSLLSSSSSSSTSSTTSSTLSSSSSSSLSSSISLQRSSSLSFSASSISFTKLFPTPSLDSSFTTFPDDTFENTWNASTWLANALLIFFPPDFFASSAAITSFIASKASIPSSSISFSLKFSCDVQRAMKFHKKYSVVLQMTEDDGLDEASSALAIVLASHFRSLVSVLDEESIDSLSKSASFMSSDGSSSSSSSSSLSSSYSSSSSSSSSAGFHTNDPFLRLLRYAINSISITFTSKARSSKLSLEATRHCTHTLLMALLSKSIAQLNQEAGSFLKLLNNTAIHVIDCAHLTRSLRTLLAAMENVVFGDKDEKQQQKQLKLPIRCNSLLNKERKTSSLSVSTNEKSEKDSSSPSSSSSSSSSSSLPSSFSLTDISSQLSSFILLPSMADKNTDAETVSQLVCRCFTKLLRKIRPENYENIHLEEIVGDSDVLMKELCVVASQRKNKENISIGLHASVNGTPKGNENASDIQPFTSSLSESVDSLLNNEEISNDIRVIKTLLYCLLEASPNDKGEKVLTALKSSPIQPPFVLPCVIEEMKVLHGNEGEATWKRISESEEAEMKKWKKIVDEFNTIKSNNSEDEAKKAVKPESFLMFSQSDLIPFSKKSSHSSSSSTIHQEKSAVSSAASAKETEKIPISSASSSDSSSSDSHVANEANAPSATPDAIKADEKTSSESNKEENKEN
ncbi:putative cytoskeleton-associated protein 5 [Monocercomonoides exilis]|uniref:putative cytoskeleton-associated protein 5 n=1 Tax=Monocercomonoides exilis TaxID=2049356 RepID=UPI003559B04F|nr:putative cytoskeleton-associated protein 5 [Monocercomonoides exilis]|eukprot:MONOS_11348.1-p1 / transcript=MONOS_11348.1 / gene=MONOS_11348 / organism=Monocercomonoides_exilis_PA203 / gene_product=microtubule associated protein xmap215 / transcript_product=microtubule associated protein xmap215 / location=Mono_scaffold00564:28654-33938(-) / protein_length=1742 / sequence_SO=supercontig / SO=protein_coding / is_pseudo=false